MFPELSLTIRQVVHSSAFTLNALIEIAGLSADQRAYCKAFRRRERNRLAASRMRQRRMDEVTELKDRLRKAKAVEVALNVLKEEKLSECRWISTRTEEVIGETLYHLRLDPRIYSLEMRDGRWKCIELWSQRIVTEDELREMQL